jgi:hypothetical protein
VYARRRVQNIPIIWYGGEQKRKKTLFQTKKKKNFADIFAKKLFIFDTFDHFIYTRYLKGAHAVLSFIIVPPHEQKRRDALLFEEKREKKKRTTTTFLRPAKRAQRSTSALERLFGVARARGVGRSGARGRRGERDFEKFSFVIYKALFSVTTDNWASSGTASTLEYIFNSTLTANT